MTRTRSETEEFVTIIAPSTGDAMRQFKAQGLDRQGFAIAGRIGQHRFSLVDGPHAADPFPGQSLVAATFSRRVPV
ncbi:hypothetical protein [Devosia sp. CN2-171]|uniref:hypothetical protein n=1 Tax=Devosia sp. CN2-171 TaxID=3400909 RepID=UPI003BF88237